MAEHPGSTDVHTSDLHITASDGYALGATLFEPQSSSGRVVLVNSAMGVKRAFYHKYAVFLANRGFTVLTYDYRGVGGSAPKRLRGFEAYLWEWGAKDLRAAVDWLGARYPAHKLLAVGHSVGGQIVGLTPNNSRITGMFAVAAQSGYWRWWPGLYKLWILFVWHVYVPVPARLLGYFPASKLGLGEDLPAGVALHWARAGRRPRYILDLYGGGECDHFASFTAPILSYSFADDHYAPRQSVDELLPLYPNAAGTRRHVRPAEVGAQSIGHFGFFRPKFEASLWADSADWLMRV